MLDSVNASTGFDFVGLSHVEVNGFIVFISKAEAV